MMDHSSLGRFEGTETQLHAVLLSACSTAVQLMAFCMGPLNLDAYFPSVLYI